MTNFDNVLGSMFFGAKTLKDLTAVEIQFDVTHSCTQLIFSIFYFHQRFWVSKNRKAKCRKKGNKGDTEMLNTHTLPFSILLKHLSGLLSHERIHI